MKTGTLDYSFFIGVDVGGTNTSIALARLSDARKLDVPDTFRFKTARLKHLREPLKKSLDYCSRQYGAGVQNVAIAAAGPVVEHRWCRLTNVDLEVDARELGVELGVSCLVLNDFEALGYSIGFLEAERLESLLELARQERRVGRTNGTKALIGAGTGLGKAILACDSVLKPFRVLPSEGGHADFVPQDPLEYELADYFRELNCWPVYYEDVLSGKGLANIYSFLRWKRLYRSSQTSAAIERARDKAAAISKYYSGDETARHTVEMFIRIYARCARNFALDVLATGGIYVAGGIAAKNVSWFTSGEFVKEFENHRQYRSLLERIPVFLITGYEAGMYGAAYVASKGEEFWSRLRCG